MAFDVHTPSPDDGHEAIRVAVVEAISGLGDAAGGVSDAYWLTDLLFGMVDGLYTANADLQTQVEDLTARMAVIEANNPPTDQPQEDAP